MLKVGTLAPQFTSTLEDGSTFDLASFRGKKNVVLYFYPRDFTAGCTAQACAFRDNYESIAEYDAVIFGVSGDSESSHVRFKELHQLPFPLIADTDRHVHKLYGVVGLLPFLTPRITYVLDKSGVIRAASRHDLRVKEHLPDVLAALKQMTTSS